MRPKITVFCPYLLDFTWKVHQIIALSWVKSKGSASVAKGPVIVIDYPFFVFFWHVFLYNMKSLGGNTCIYSSLTKCQSIAGHPPPPRPLAFSQVSQTAHQELPNLPCIKGHCECWVFCLSWQNTKLTKCFSFKSYTLLSIYLFSKVLQGWQMNLPLNNKLKCVFLTSPYSNNDSWHFDQGKNNFTM